MKRTSLVLEVVLAILLSLCTTTLVAQPPEDSVYVSFTSVGVARPLTSVIGLLHGDDCDSVRIDSLVFTWHSSHPPYSVPQPLDWKAGHGQEVPKNFPLPPTVPGPPEDAHLWYYVYPSDGARKSLDIDPLVSGRPYKLAPGCGGVPIQLSSFTGTIVNNRVRLDWITVSEVNNYGFVVQKKRAGEMEWNEIPNSFVAGHGTTNLPRRYTFTDSTVVTSPVQYRLNQIDLDGTNHFTEAIHIGNATSVNQVAPLEFALQQNYPNPFNPTTEIRYQIPDLSHVTLKVFDLLGREIVTLLDDVQEAGYKSVEFDASAIANGVYFYRLEAKNFISTRKLIVLK
jgi:hypothetical protein